MAVVERRPFDATAAAADMDTKLLPFQREGVAFGQRCGGRLLVADEMGCGKSAQAIRLCLARAAEPISKSSVQILQRASRGRPQ